MLNQKELVGVANDQHTDEEIIFSDTSQQIRISKMPMLKNFEISNSKNKKLCCRLKLVLKMEMDVKNICKEAGLDAHNLKTKG